MGRVNEAALRGLMGQRGGERRPGIVAVLPLIRRAWEPGIRETRSSLSLSFSLPLARLFASLDKAAAFLPRRNIAIKRARMQNRSFAHLCGRSASRTSERASLHDARFCARGCAAILAIIHVAGGYVYNVPTFISIKILFVSFPIRDAARIEPNPETRETGSRVEDCGVREYSRIGVRRGRRRRGTDYYCK